MGTPAMVVLIVLIVTIGRILAPRYRQRHAAPADDQLHLAAVREARDEIRQLKERVAVLERVVTDNHGSIGLDREIERLRDR